MRSKVRRNQMIASYYRKINFSIVSHFQITVINDRDTDRIYRENH